MVLVVNKEKLTEIKQAEVDGKIHDIGSFMPFNSSDLLKEKIGKQSPISFAFTKLTGSNTHNIHSHSTDSMVIVTKGSAKLIGDKEKNVCEGDVIFIPEGCKHGFSCEAGEEIECISIQFESESLFSEKNDINFLSNQLYRPVNSLYETNEQLAQDAENSKVFTMFKSGLMKDKKNLSVFKKYLHQWSSAFQTIMFMRQATTQNKEYKNIFLEHFEDELGHDKMLESDEVVWDPQVASYSSWFIQQMVQADNIEKLVIVHLVLEKCADIFHIMAMNHSSNEDQYIGAHAELDHDHADLGSELLENIDNATCQNLVSLSNQAWDIMTLLLDRITDLTLKEIESRKELEAV